MEENKEFKKQLDTEKNPTTLDNVNASKDNTVTTQQASPHANAITEAFTTAPPLEQHVSANSTPVSTEENEFTEDSFISEYAPPTVSNYTDTTPSGDSGQNASSVITEPPCTQVNAVVALTDLPPCNTQETKLALDIS